jgi:hypothetical protein
MEIIEREKVTMTIEEFFIFIEMEIEKYRRHSTFEAKTDVSFADLQEKLMEYTGLSLSLTQLQARYRYQAKALKRAFNAWFDSLVVETQKQYNRLDIAKTKWLTSTELERIARVDSAEEYKKRLEEFESMESREKFINNLIENWQSHSYVLSQMSANVRSEVGTLGMEGKLSH